MTLQRGWVRGVTLKLNCNPHFFLQILKEYLFQRNVLPLRRHLVSISNEHVVPIGWHATLLFLTGAKFLNGQYPEKWIGPVQRPPTSPDITSAILFLYANTSKDEAVRGGSFFLTFFETALALSMKCE